MNFVSDKHPATFYGQSFTERLWRLFNLLVLCSVNSYIQIRMDTLSRQGANRGVSNSYREDFQRGMGGADADLSTTINRMGH
jgi:hypothetical protein